MKYIRIIIIVATFIALMFVGYQAYLYFGRGAVTIRINPSDVSFTIDDKAYNAAQATNIQLSPGEHDLQIAPDGFKSINKTITVGWQEDIDLTYKLEPKSFKEIYRYLSPDVTATDYQAVQAKNFLNNTWSAAYLVPNDEESGEITVAVINRKNGAWRLVLHDHGVTEDAREILPAEVYNYIKDFGE